jgi:hypothetical protein
LALFHIAPSMVFAGLDDITVRTGDRRHPPEEHAARLVRYFLLVSGFVPNHGNLIDPNDMSSENPYMARFDPRYPLTNPHHLRRIKQLILAREPVPSEITTSTQARVILNLLRRTLGPSGIMGWAEARHHRNGLRAGVRYTRALAGEVGPDRYLAHLLGGDVSPPRRPRRHVLHRRLPHAAPMLASAFSSDTDPFAELHREALDGSPVPGALLDNPNASPLPDMPPPDGVGFAPPLEAVPESVRAAPVVGEPAPSGPPLAPAPDEMPDPSQPRSDTSGIKDPLARRRRDRSSGVAFDPFADLELVTRSRGLP